MEMKTQGTERTSFSGFTRDMTDRNIMMTTMGISVMIIYASRCSTFYIIDVPVFQKYPTPYKKIALCLPFWAAVVAHCGQNWGFFTLMTEMPTYMAEVLHFKIAKVPYTYRAYSETERD